MAGTHSLVVLAFGPECITSAPTTTHLRGPRIVVIKKNKSREHGRFGLPRRHMQKHRRIRQVFSSDLRVTEKISQTWAVPPLTFSVLGEKTIKMAVPSITQPQRVNTLTQKTRKSQIHEFVRFRHRLGYPKSHDLFRCRRGQTPSTKLPHILHKLSRTRSKLSLLLMDTVTVNIRPHTTQKSDLCTLLQDVA